MSMSGVAELCKYDEALKREVAANREGLEPYMQRVACSCCCALSLLQAWTRWWTPLQWWIPLAWRHPQVRLAVRPVRLLVRPVHLSCSAMQRQSRQQHRQLLISCPPNTLHHTLHSAAMYRVLPSTFPDAGMSARMLIGANLTQVGSNYPVPQVNESELASTAV